MFDIFVQLKQLVKIKHVKIDSFVFRLHWGLTAIALVTFSVIITARQYIGDPIDCIHNKDIPKEVFDLYCWLHSSYTIPRGLKMPVGAAVPHPGILTSNRGYEGERKYTSYYPWVGLVLFLQVLDKN